MKAIISVAANHDRVTEIGLREKTGMISFAMAKPAG